MRPFSSFRSPKLVGLVEPILTETKLSYGTLTCPGRSLHPFLVINLMDTAVVLSQPSAKYFNSGVSNYITDHVCQAECFVQGYGDSLLRDTGFPESPVLVQVPSDAARLCLERSTRSQTVQVVLPTVLATRTLRSGGSRVCFQISSDDGCQDDPGGRVWQLLFSAEFRCRAGFGSSGICGDTLVSIIFPPNSVDASLGSLTVRSPVENKAFGIILPIRFIDSLRVIVPVGRTVVTCWAQVQHPGFSVSSTLKSSHLAGELDEMIRISGPVSDMVPTCTGRDLVVGQVEAARRGVHTVLQLHASYLAVQHIVFEFCSAAPIKVAVVLGSVCDPLYLVSDSLLYASAFSMSRTRSHYVQPDPVVPLSSVAF